MYSRVNIDSIRLVCLAKAFLSNKLAVRICPLQVSRIRIYINDATQN